MKKLMGFTLIELLMALAIIVILAGLLVSPFAKFRQNQILTAAAENILSVISRARSQTLAAKNDLTFGVHFAANAVTIFSGQTYNPNDPSNDIVPLDGAVAISAIDLTGGVTAIFFERLSGAASAVGTITVSLTDDQSRFRRITILPTGLIDVE